MKTSRYGFSIVLVALFAACDGITPLLVLPPDRSDSTSSANPNAMVLAENARLVRPDSGLAIRSVEDDVLTMAISPEQAVPVPGQILVSLDGEWIIRRIVALESQGEGAFRVQTEPASLEEAFAELHLEGSSDLSPPHDASSEPKSEVTARAISGSANLSFNRSFNDTMTASNGSRFSYNVAANGGLTVRVSIDISSSTLRAALFNVSGNAGLRVSGTLSAPAGSTFSAERRLTPNGVNIGCIPTNIPGVCIPVFLNAYAGLSATIGTSANVGIQAGASGSITAGVEKANGMWVPTFSKNFTPSLSVTAAVPGSVSGELYARGRISAFSSDGNGPWVDLKLPKITLSAQRVNGRWQLCLAPRVGLTVGFSLPATYAGIRMPCSNCWSYTFRDQPLSNNASCWNF